MGVHAGATPDAAVRAEHDPLFNDTPSSRGPKAEETSAVTIEDLQNAEVLSWREQRLLRMGFDPERAHEVARTNLDLHELEPLLGRRCPPQTAVAILR
jgi:hypothetical protein